MYNISKYGIKRSVSSLDLNISTLDLQHIDAVKEILAALGHTISPFGIPFYAEVCEKGFSVERKNGGLTVVQTRSITPTPPALTPSRMPIPAK